MRPLLQIQGAEFGYSSKTTIFSDVDLALERGEILCLMGPNGCGKSTLIDTILGMHTLRKGQISVEGKPLAHLKPHEFASHIAYVPQAHAMTFPYSVEDVVLMGRTHFTRGFEAPSEQDRMKAIEAIHHVGLKGFEQRSYTELSGGEVQLVMLARALAQEAHIMLMDEPTAHLDFRHELTVLEIICKLVEEKDLSVLMATHFLNQAFFLESNGIPTKVALMNDRIIEPAGTPSAVLTQENLARIFGMDVWVEEIARFDQKRKIIVPIKNSARLVEADESGAIENVDAQAT